MSQISGLLLEQLYVIWIVCSLQVSLWYEIKKNPDSCWFAFFLVCFLQYIIVFDCKLLYRNKGGCQYATELEVCQTKVEHARIVIRFFLLLFTTLCFLPSVPFLPFFLLPLRLWTIDGKWYVAKHENWSTWIFWCFWRSGPNTIWRKTS